MSALLVDPYRERAAQLGDGWDRSPLGLVIPPRVRRRYELPVAVDLFAGAGGFSMGFHQAGFHVAAASDAWPTAAMTYLVNLARYGHVNLYFDTPEREADFTCAVEHMLRLDAKSRRKHEGLIGGQEEWAKRGPMSVAGSGWIAGQPPSVRGCEHYFLYDIRNLTGEIILDALGLDVGEVAVVMGGPPCQGFSAAGKRNVMDPRNSLVFEFARLVCEIMPRTFVMENVPAIESMVTPEGVPVLDAFALAVSDGGYGEYDALRRALRGLDARTGVRGAKRAKGTNGQDRSAKPTKKARKAAAAARTEQQPDLFGGAAEAEASDA